MTGTALGAPRTDRALPRGRHARVEHRPRPAKVVVVGQGRAGVQVALRAVRAGYLVIGLDRDVRRISRLAHGRSGVDAATDTALVAALRGGDYVPTGDRRLAEGFDTAVIAATDEPAAAP
jgi:UDP-N-acetyl-D-mannosaminuronate dehydrogenase